MEEIGALVDDTVAGADMCRLLQLTDQTCPLDEAAASFAARYVQEWSLYAWGRDLSVERGLAPRTKAVLGESAAYRARCTGGVLPPPRRDIAPQEHGYGRHGGAQGGMVATIVSARDQPDLAEMHAKVSVFFHLILDTGIGFTDTSGHVRWCRQRLPDERPASVNAGAKHGPPCGSEIGTAGRVRGTKSWSALRAQNRSRALVSEWDSYTDPHCGPEISAAWRAHGRARGPEIEPALRS